MTYNVSTSAGATVARDRLAARIQVGQNEQDLLITAVANLHIYDRLVPPTKMLIKTGGGKTDKPRLCYLASEETPGIGIHPHALGQMCGVTGLPKLYANRLMSGEQWERSLFDTNINELFHCGKYLDRSGKPAKFLHRIVGGELRGFLSRNFNRQLASMPLLNGFVSACAQVGAQPVEATTSAVRFALKCFLPYVFEPVDGEYVAVGVVWSNSDFGAGRLKVALTTMRIRSNTTAILGDVMSRVHIGSIIQDSDLELSDEAARKEVEAQIAVIRDAVNEQLGPAQVDRLLEAITTAHEEQIPWHRLKAELGRILQKNEMMDVKKLLESGADDIVDLPAVGRTDGGDPVATRWWASNVVSWMASKEQSLERQNELQQLAGDLLGKNKA